MDSLRQILHNLEFKEVVPGVNAFSVCYKDGTVLHVRSGSVSMSRKKYLKVGNAVKESGLPIPLNEKSKVFIQEGFLVTRCGKTFDIDHIHFESATERPIYLQDGV